MSTGGTAQRSLAIPSCARVSLVRAASKGVPGGARDACLSFDEDDQIQDDVNFNRVSLAFDIMFFCDIFLNHFTAYMPSKTTETDEKGVLQVRRPKSPRTCTAATDA